MEETEEFHTPSMMGGLDHQQQKALTLAEAMIKWRQQHRRQRRRVVANEKDRRSIFPGRGEAVEAVDGDSYRITLVLRFAGKALSRDCHPTILLRQSYWVSVCSGVV